MTDAEWDINKSCELKHRDHKWQWLSGDASTLPSLENAQCVHCGKLTVMRRDNYGEKG